MQFKLPAVLVIFLLSGQIGLAQDFKIKGSLQNGLTSEMISGAKITLRQTAFSSTSKNDGNFILENLYEDKFVINIVADGFQSHQAQVEVKGELNLGTITLYPIGYSNPSGALQKTIRATNIAELFVNRPNFIGGNAVFGIPPEPKQLLGNFYLDPKWNKASILLYRDKEVVEGYFARYNINSNMFEIRSEDSDEVSTIPGLRIQNIVWIDSEHMVPRYFVNGMDFKEDGSPILGFFEVLVDGQIPLVRRTKATIKESNYNETLMIGNRDHQILKRNSYYYIKDSELNEIPRKRKKIYSVFGDQAQVMQDFVRENQVNLKDISGLFVLFTQYNSLFTGFDPLVPKLMID